VFLLLLLFLLLLELLLLVLLPPSVSQAVGWPLQWLLLLWPLQPLLHRAL
jgi:hypothetical protein